MNWISNYLYDIEFIQYSLLQKKLNKISGLINKDYLLIHRDENSIKIYGTHNQSITIYVDPYIKEEEKDTYYNYLEKY